MNTHRAVRVALVVVTFLLSLTPMGSRETLSTENRLEQIGWLVGGKWVAEAEGPDGKLMIRESFFEWAANRRALRFWSVVKLNDGKIFSHKDGEWSEMVGLLYERQ